MVENPYWTRRGRVVTLAFITVFVLFAVLGFAGILPFSVVLVIGILIVLSRLAVLRFSHL